MKKSLFFIPIITLCLATPLLICHGSLAAEPMPDMPQIVWPVDKVPADIPPYPDGRLTASAGTGEGEYTIRIMATSEAALKAYLNKLQGMGWEISSDKYESVAIKGAYRVAMQIQGVGSLQMTIYTAEKGAWPGRDKVPEALTPPKGCNLVDVQLSENGDEGKAWLLNFTCQGMTGEKANAYMDGLLASGWSGDRSMATRNTTWRGKTCGISVEIYDTAGGNVAFTVNFGEE